MRYEYKVVPAPVKGLRKGGKTPEARFAAALTAVMNDLAVEGWEYWRTDTLPAQERAGLTGSTTTWRHMLVFRRQIAVPVVAGGEVSQPRAPVFSARPVRAAPETSEDADPDNTAPEPAAAARPAEDPEIAAPVRKLFASDAGASAPERTPPLAGPRRDVE